MRIPFSIYSPPFLIRTYALASRSRSLTHIVLLFFLENWSRWERSCDNQRILKEFGTKILIIVNERAGITVTLPERAAYKTAKTNIKPKG